MYYSFKMKKQSDILHTKPISRELYDDITLFVLEAYQLHTAPHSQVGLF